MSASDAETDIARWLWIKLLARMAKKLAERKAEK